MKKYTYEIVNWLIRRDVISEADYALYVYAVNSFILLLFPILLGFTIGLVLSDVLNGILLAMLFVFLRKYSGGYHAKNIKYCIIGSSLLLFLCMKVSQHLAYDWKLVLVTTFTAVCLIKNSPIENDRKPIEDSEKRAYKRKMVFLALLFVALAISFHILKRDRMAVATSIGVQMVAYLQLLGIVQNKVTPKL